MMRSSSELMESFAGGSHRISNIYERHAINMGKIHITTGVSNGLELNKNVKCYI